MICFLNQQPLLVTMDLIQQARLRILLRKAGIPHRIKITRLSNEGRHDGLQGPMVDYSHQYTIYVRRRDYAHAQRLLQPALLAEHAGSGSIHAVGEN